MQKAAEGKSIIELMEQLDDNLVYGGARRISDYELELLDQMDENFDCQIKMQKDLERSVWKFEPSTRNFK